MTNTTSNSAEKSGDADKTTALPVSPGVSDKDESEKNDETSSNTEEIRKVVGDPSVHTHKKEEKSAGIVVKQEPSSEPEDEKFEEQMSNFEEKNSDNVDGHSPSAPEEEAPPSKSDDITNGQPEEMEVNDPENSTKVDRMETEEGKADDEANKNEDSQDGRDHKCKDDEVEPDKTDASSPMETSDIDTENAEQGEGKMEAEKLDSPQETQDSAESEKQLSHMETEDTQPPDKKDAEDERGSVENGKEGIDSQKVCQDNLGAPPVSASGAEVEGTTAVKEESSEKDTESSETAASKDIETIVSGQTVQTAGQKTGTDEVVAEKSDNTVKVETSQTAAPSKDKDVAAGEEDSSAASAAEKIEAAAEVKDKAVSELKSHNAVPPETVSEVANADVEKPCKRPRSPLCDPDDRLNKKAKFESVTELEEELPEKKQSIKKDVNADQDIKKDIMPDLSKINLELFKKELTALVAKAYEERRREDRATIAVLKQKVSTLQEQNKQWEQKIKQLRQSTTIMMKDQERTYLMAVMSRKQMSKEMVSVGVQVQADAHDKETNTVKTDGTQQPSLVIGSTVPTAQTPKAAAPLQPATTALVGSPAVAETSSPSQISLSQAAGNQVLPRDSAIVTRTTEGHTEGQTDSLKNMLNAPSELQTQQASQTTPATVSSTSAPAVQHNKPTTSSTPTTATPDVLTIKSTGPVQSAAAKSRVPGKPVVAPPAAGKKPMVVIDLTEDEESSSSRTATSASPAQKDSATLPPQKQQQQQGQRQSPQQLATQQSQQQKPQPVQQQQQQVRQQ
ncbi:protein starmaker-like, partial [Ptychodera flava]|uniref:protein starmaker-like n=1 Tax=Ptychodera flava TaxID=63121 RepID=UPI00396A58F3